MTVLQLSLWVACSGAVGGVCNCLISGEFKAPHSDGDAKVWRPGWLGNIVTGMVAAVVVWITNSPFASTDVSNIFYTQANLSIMQLVMSLLVGISGCQILTQMSQKNAERLTSQTLARILKDKI